MKKIINYFNQTEQKRLKKVKQMLNKKYLMLMLILLITNQIHAEIVSEENANKVAANYLKSEEGKPTMKVVLHYKQVDADGNVDFYVFNFFATKGFVIVTGDDKLQPILAYSIESSFDTAKARKSGVGWWMNKMKNQIQAAKKSADQPEPRIAQLWTSYLSGTPVMHVQSSSVLALLNTTWDQWTYYNSLCPSDGNCGNCPTGCTATAMAQIMKYWNYPPRGNGYHSYHDDVGSNPGTYDANFGATTYDWTNMPPAVTSSNNAVATLMYQCGVAVEMDYESDESGAPILGSAPSSKAAYVDYFGYSTTIDGKNRNVYNLTHSLADWIDLLKTELDFGRPVQYAGGDHTWVIDGYNTSDWFHMNWGWGGEADGWFNINDLTPTTYDSHGMPTPHFYDSDEEALIGIRPNNLSMCAITWPLTAPQMYEYTWQAAVNISSSSLMMPGVYCTYTAGVDITLLEGFWATAGVNFTAKIQPCITPKLGGNSPHESAEKVEEKNLLVYPNPFSSIINLKYKPTCIGKLKIEVMDIQGKTIKSITQEISEKDVAIDIPLNLQNIPSGFYFLKVSDGISSSVQKIIKT